MGPATGRRESFGPCNPRGGKKEKKKHGASREKGKTKKRVVEHPVPQVKQA